MRQATVLLMTLVTSGLGCATVQPSSAPAFPPPSVASSPQDAPRVSLELVAARAAHTATALASGDVFVAGGCVVDGCGRATRDTFIIAADGAGATQGPLMVEPRDGHTATLTIDGDVVLVGGFPGEGGGTLDTVELYRSATGELTVIDPLAQARGGHVAALLPDGTVLVGSGWIASHAYTATAEIVDPASGVVRLAPSMAVAADARDGVTLADGRVLVTGGQVRPAVATDSAEIYDPMTGDWHSVAPLGTPRLKHSSVLLQDGRVLVIGGTPDDQNLLATTEIFDPATEAFSPGPDLAEGRYKMPGSVIVLDADRVLIGGGGRSIELLDLAAGSSRIIATFIGRGSFTTLSPLGGGSFLVLGGYDDQIALRRQFRILTSDDLT